MYIIIIIILRESSYIYCHETFRVYS